MYDKPVAGVPNHIGIIMDGNGRWAAKRGLPRKAGHVKGADVFERIVEYCIKLEIKAMTFYAFSSENWKRPADEVNALMNLIDKNLDKLISKISKYDVSVKFIGDISKLNIRLITKMNDIEHRTKNRKMTLSIAINYGGRDEIVYAANKAIAKNKGGQITAEMIEKELYTCEVGDPDLIIRTANERRLSNFLLWQCAYSEFWFTDVLWPDFTEKTLDEAISDYSERKRRYGGL